MRVVPKCSTLSLVAVPLAAAVHGLLGALQYWWTGELSRAERDRMRMNLHANITHFREGFYRELAAVCGAFPTSPLDTPRRAAQNLTRRYEEWVETGTRPALVANVFMCQGGHNGNWQLLRLDQTSRRFEPSAWAGRLEALRPYLNSRGLGSRGALIPEHLRLRWRFAEQVPVLLHPILAVAPTVGNHRRYMARRLIGYCLIELNLGVLRQEILPELARRYSGGPDILSYQLAVISGNDLSRPIYEFDPEQPLRNLASADAVVPLMGGRPEDAFRLPVGSRTESHQTSGRRSPFSGSADQESIRYDGRQ